MRQKLSYFWILALAIAPWAGGAELQITTGDAPGAPPPPPPPAAAAYGDPMPAPAPMPDTLAARPLPEMSPSAALPLWPPARDILRMVQAGVPDDVVRSYINNSPNAFNLSADGIIYLQKAKVPNPVTAEMLLHDKALRDQMAPPPSAPAYANPPRPQPVAPPPQQTYAYANPGYQGSTVQTYTIPNTDYNPYGTWAYGADYGWYFQPYTYVGYPWGLSFRGGGWYNHGGHGVVWSPGYRLYGGGGGGVRGGGGFGGHTTGGGSRGFGGRR